jgi:hypothetical protein
LQVRGVVTLTTNKPVFQLEIETLEKGRRFRREVSSESCKELADTAALIIALSLRPEINGPASTSPAIAATEANPPATRAAKPAEPPGLEADSALNQTETHPTVGVEERPLPAPKARPKPKPIPPRLRPPAPAKIVNPNTAETSPESPALPADEWLGLSVALNVIGHGWLLPAFAAGSGLELAYEYRAWRAELFGVVLAKTRQQLATDPPRGGDLWAAGGGARGCYGFTFPSLNSSSVRGCVGAEGNRISGRAYGTQWAKAASSAFFALNAGAALRIVIFRHLGLALRAEAVVPFSRPEFGVENVGSLRRSETLGVRLSGGLEAIF